VSEDLAPPPATPYALLGGAEFFDRLVTAFYERVAVDPVLRPMYPPGDLAPAQRRLTMFLEQYWGGPQAYGDERGHPRLRMRHASFPIDAVARDRWLSHMHDAMSEQDMAPESEQLLWQYLVSAAFAMQNVHDQAPPGAIDLTEASP
jgi:hemoglobin